MEEERRNGIYDIFLLGRMGTIFTSGTLFCDIWTVSYGILLELSIFMVAQITVSRLILFICPNTNFFVSCSWIAPLCYFILTLTIKITNTLLKVTTFAYVPPLMACVYIALDGTVTDQGEPMVHLPNELLLAVIETIQTGFTVIPISLCSVLCLCLLQRSKQRTRQLGGSRKKQEEATKTVLIFTALYVICSVPIFVYNIFFWIWNLSIDRSEIYMVNSQFLRSYLEVYSTDFLVNYSSVLVTRVFPVINSALNPCIFFWRMETFRAIVVGKLRGLTTAWSTQTEG